MSTPEVRLSPTGKEAAIRYGVSWWHVTGTYALLSDRDVEGWTPLLPVPNQDGAELEQLPPALDRAADELHRGH